MFSINPLYPRQVTGGASKHLYQIAQYLGKLGHEIDILCAQSKENSDHFQWSKNVSIFPLLPFHLPFPQPYAVSAPDLGLMVETLSKFLLDADRFYLHDGEWLIPDIYDEIPTVVSFRDNIYPESVLGTFIQKADDILCVSEYSAEVLSHTVGRFFPGLSDRIRQVNNGIDLGFFSPKDASQLAQELKVNPSEQIILLHPHRPETGKGFPETIRVVDRLVHQYGMKNIRVLIPEWIGEMVSASDSKFYNAMMKLIQDLDVRQYFVFIPWMPIERMPELYSLGDVTLCLGNIVEAFGNVAYESQACGTPSLVANVGVHRTLMPDHLIHKVHYGDIDGAVKKIISIIEGHSPSHNEIREYLGENFSFDHQLSTYADVIVRAKKRKHLKFSYLPSNIQGKYRLAPWCYCHGGRVYHDFRGYFEIEEELTLLCQKFGEFSFEHALGNGVRQEIWQSWIQKTLIVPVINGKER
jgi:glycosyltransferase involved in cell wall biosynthesis